MLFVDKRIWIFLAGLFDHAKLVGKWLVHTDGLSFASIAHCRFACFWPEYGCMFYSLNSTTLRRHLRSLRLEVTCGDCNCATNVFPFCFWASFFRPNAGILAHRQVLQIRPIEGDMIWRHIQQQVPSIGMVKGRWSCKSHDLIPACIAGESVIVLSYQFVPLQGLHSLLL